MNPTRSEQTVLSAWRSWALRRSRSVRENPGEPIGESTPPEDGEKDQLGSSKDCQACDQAILQTRVSTIETGRRCIVHQDLSHLPDERWIHFIRGGHFAKWPCTRARTLQISYDHTTTLVRQSDLRSRNRFLTRRKSHHACICWVARGLLGAGLLTPPRPRPKICRRFPPPIPD